MTDKQIDGLIALYLTDAVEHFAKLELEMTKLRRCLCVRSDAPGDSRNARKHCRRLIEALELIDHRLHDDNKVVSIDEQRKKP